MLSSFAKIKLINYDNSNVIRTSSPIVANYTREQLKKYMKDTNSPSNQKQLRLISRFLYYSSSHYRSLINYYSTLYNFDYVVEGYDTDITKINNKENYKKAYLKSASAFEQLNIKYESLKIRAHCYVDGIFYGYVRRTGKSFFIQQFDPDICKLSFLDAETGLYGYSFNFSIFNNEDLLDNFPPEFKTIYNNLKLTKQPLGWIKIESSNAICIKPTIGFDIVPPLVGVFEGILDIYEFKALAKGKEKIGNYQILAQKIPMNTKDNTENGFLLTEDFIKIFHENVASNLPDEIGLVTSPMDIEAIKLERDTVDKNKVTEATSQYWNEAGVSELLFGNSTSSTGLKMSITADESALSNVVIGIQQWINEYSKSFKNSYAFRCRILHTTKFNEKEFIESRLKLASSSLPLVHELAAAIGMSPSQTALNSFLENEVFKYYETLRPLSTSYTQSDSESGRPASETGTLSPSGEKNIENDVTE